MADYGTNQSKISWTTIKIRTLITWGLTAFIVIVGGGTYYYFTFIVGSPVKKAESAITEARVELSKLENHEKSIPELFEEPEVLLIEAEDAFRTQKYEIAIQKAEESYDLSKTEFDRLVAAGAGHKSATFRSLEGSVQVRKKDRQEWTDAKERMPLYAGDYIKTGNDSGAVIIFFDSSQYKIQENAMILIEKSFEDPATKRTDKAIKIDDGHVDVSTVDPAIPGSTSTVSTPSSKTTFNEKSDSAIAYDKKTDKTNISLFAGSANTRVGDRIVKLEKNEKIRIKGGNQIGQKIKLLTSPLLLAPPHREIFEIDKSVTKVITFSWSKLAGAEEYLLEISKNQMFLKPERKWTSKTSRSLKGFNHGSYFWRVTAARNAKQDKSKSSDPIKFILRQKTVTNIDDKTPPPISIHNAYPLGEFFLISGTTEPGATLTVNNIEWTVQSDGTFKDLIQLKNYGINIVVFRAVDAAGNIAIKRIKLELK
jgi:hypothetical protein